jgi:hypothetical protein
VASSLRQARCYVCHSGRIDPGWQGHRHSLGGPDARSLAHQPWRVADAGSRADGHDPRCVLVVIDNGRHVPDAGAGMAVTLAVSHGGNTPEGAVNCGPVRDNAGRARRDSNSQPSDP